MKHIRDINGRIHRFAPRDLSVKDRLRVLLAIVIVACFAATNRDAFAGWAF